MTHFFSNVFIHKIMSETNTISTRNNKSELIMENSGIAAPISKNFAITAKSPVMIAKGTQSLLKISNPSYNNVETVGKRAIIHPSPLFL